jgi:hypothetical protein
MSEGERISEGRRQAYRAINFSSAPFWLAMILAPRSPVTRRLLDGVTPLFLGLGATYDALLLKGIAERGGPIDFADGEAVRSALATPDLFLAGWAHYIAFDLFVGRWIWEDALERGRSARLALLLTWLGGPAGLSLYLIQRRV